MKCTNCEMVDQLPGTKCSHCGRLIPEPKPVVMTKAMDDDASAETETDSQDEKQEVAPPDDKSPAPADETVVPQKGRVDNVGDKSEKETIVP